MIVIKFIKYIFNKTIFLLFAIAFSILLLIVMYNITTIGLNDVIQNLINSFRLHI